MPGCVNIAHKTLGEVVWTAMPRGLPTTWRSDRSWRASLNRGNDLGHNRPPGAYFDLFFPVGMLGSIVTATGDNTRAGRKKPDRAELLQLFGYIMAMSLQDVPGPRAAAASPSRSSPRAPQSPGTNHHIQHLKHHRKYASPTKQRRVGDKGGKAKEPKLTCSACGKPNAARYYCADCSTDGGSIVAVCGLGTERDCISRHVQGGD